MYHISGFEPQEREEALGFLNREHVPFISAQTHREEEFQHTDFGAKIMVLMRTSRLRNMSL